MKTSLLGILSAGLLLASASCASKETPPVASVQCRGQAAMVTTTLKVDAVDAAKRTVTLKSPEGASGTFVVGPEVKRLSEVKAGDSLVVQYHVGVLAELRDPTPEEKSTPVQILEGVSRAPSDVPPTGALSRAVKVVTIIDAMDPKAETITLKGPLGNTITFKPEDYKNVSGLKTGQTVIATFAEQLVLAVEPGSKQ
jgi:hypothetical protein